MSSGRLASLDQNPRRGKKLQAQIRVRRNPFASGCCIGEKPFPTTEYVSGVGNWAEGGVYRAEMQAAGAALVTGLAGGNALGGAAGAGIASIAGGKLNELSGAIAGSNPTGNADMNQALGNIVANAIATGAGGAIGGDAGAFSGYNVDRFNRQLHPEEYAMAKKDAKIVAQQLGISEQEAEGRVVAEILRNSDKQTADTSGGVHDWEVRSIIGCQNLNCDGYKSDPQYANHDYNSQYIASNQRAYDVGQQQLGTGLTDAGLRDQNIEYERTGKAALAVTACLVSGGVACKAAATGLGITALTNYATGKPVTTAETIGGFVGGGIGGIYGANLSAWAGDASGWVEKAVLGITKAAPTYAGKQAGIPLGNATGLGGSVDPLLDPATNSWWGFQNTMENLKGTKK